MGTGEQPSAPQRSSPFFSRTSCFVCVSHGAVVTGARLHWCVAGQGCPWSLPLPYPLTVLCWDWQLSVNPAAVTVDAIDNHRRVGRDPKGHLGHSGLACPVHRPHLQSRCTAGSPRGAGKAHPHFLIPLCSYTRSPSGTPAIPAHPHPSYSAEGNPLITQTHFTSQLQSQPAAP